MSERRLPDAELDVMACLWREGPATARRLREALADKRPMAHASISTLLKRLEEKGLGAREKGPVGKAFVYRARGKPAKTYRRMLGDLLDRVFDGSGVALVASLFETRPPSEEEIDELERLVRELRTKGRPESTSAKERRRSS